MFVLITPNGGYYGPFKTANDAVKWVEKNFDITARWTVTRLRSPES